MKAQDAPISDAEEHRNAGLTPRIEQPTARGILDGEGHTHTRVLWADFEQHTCQQHKAAVRNIHDRPLRAAATIHTHIVDSDQGMLQPHHPAEVDTIHEMYGLGVDVVLSE